MGRVFRAFLWIAACVAVSVAFAEGTRFNAYAPYQDRGTYSAAMESMSAVERKIREHSRRLGHLADDLQSAPAGYFDTVASELIGDRLSRAEELLSIQTNMRDLRDFKFVATGRALAFSELKKDCQRTMSEIDKRLHQELIKSKSVFDEAKSMRETLPKLCEAFAKAAEE